MASRQNLTSAAPRIGVMLIDGEYIVPQDLDFALEHQQHSKGLIGEILVRIGAVDSADLEQVLEKQKKLNSK